MARFFNVTGLTAKTIRAAASAPGFTASILDYVLDDEPLLAAHRTWSPPLQVALCDRLRPADLRRGVLVRVERRLQAVLCRAAGAVCPRGRGGTGSHPRARARQRGLAHC